MNLVIHTYGHIDSMFYVLNGIAMLMNHIFAELVMVTVALGTTAYYAFRISYANTIAYKTHLAKVAGMIAMMYFLLIPRADMLINDHVSKKKEKVDNLPLGFALPIGILENFGDLLTGGFEQAFTTVGNTNYRDYGMVFGARLVQESRNWRIRTPEFIENMSNFIDRCVMIDAMIGHYYTPQDLIQSNDVWRLVKTHAGTFRKVAIRRGKARTLQNCKEAANEIEAAFMTEIDALQAVYQATDFGQAGYANYVDRKFDRINNHFKRNIEISFKGYVGSMLSGDDLIKQQMMINSIRNYGDEYGYARASTTQESNWMIAGDLAGTYIPILMTVLKGLVYSSFVFMLPLLIMSGGWSRYISYLMLVASFQLWGPLNAVLNMFIDLYSSNTLQGISGSIVSFSTASRIGSYTDKIVAVASGLQMAIPFLAFSIIQGGVSGFIHLAGTITGASQSAAATAANESVTNNRTFDNYSIGNQQFMMHGGFKTDWNESYAAGGRSYQHMDGVMERVTPGGNTLFQSGVGYSTSSGSTAYRQEDSRHAQVTEGVQEAESIHEQDLRTASNAKSNTLSHTSDYVAHLAQREHAGESFNYDSMGEQGKTLQQAVNHTKQLHDKRSYGWEQAAKAGIETSVNISTPLKQVIAFGGSITGSGGVSATNSSDQSVEEGVNINRDNITNENYQNIIRAASNSSWAKENSIDTSYSDSVRQSYEEQQRLEKHASISQQRVDDWHKAKAVIDSQGSSSSRDRYQDVVEGIKHDHGVDGYTAQQMADKYSPEAQQVWVKLQNDDHYVQKLVDNIRHSSTEVSGGSATHKLEQFTERHNAGISHDTRTIIKQHSINEGMNVDTLHEGIQGAKGSIEQKLDHITAENSVQYKSVKKHNEMEEIRVQKQADKYEEDRIGKGVFASKTAAALGEVTVGRAGWTLGAPDKYAHMDTDNSTHPTRSNDDNLDKDSEQKANNTLIKDK